ncbi:MAG: hypothetical protein PVJ09_04175 [Candidatus Woesebacteria bacterium]|jgi:hypothetical protein
MKHKQALFGLLLVLKKEKKLIAICFALCALFLFLRIYKLTSSFELFADIGRDLHVLMLMVIEKKPPLLGPSTSWLPINQSPIYFYMLVPIFLLSGFSGFTVQLTVFALYLVFFVLGVLFLRQDKLLLAVLLVTALLLTMHPEVVLQTRLPWNPSFAPPFLLMSIFVLVLLRQKFSQLKLFFLSLGLVIAIALSYSNFPILSLFFLYLLFSFRKNRQRILSLFSSFFVSFLIAFLPILIFELRNKFFFFKRLTMDEPFLMKPKIDYLQKLTLFLKYLGGSFLPEMNSLVLLVMFLALLINLILIKGQWWHNFLNRKNKNAKAAKKVSKNKAVKKTNFSEQDQLFLFFLKFFLLIFFFTLLMPFKIMAHYIFATLCLLFVTLALIRKELLLPLLVILALIWLRPRQVIFYTAPAKRTVAQLEACAKKVCQIEKEPLFVTVQAWYHYHFAPDHIFFMNKHGCQARDITQSPGFANKMAVVSDQSKYEHGKTAFNELTLFGESELMLEYHCEGNISIYILERVAE